MINSSKIEIYKWIRFKFINVDLKKSSKFLWINVLLNSVIVGYFLESFLKNFKFKSILRTKRFHRTFLKYSN